MVTSLHTELHLISAAFSTTASRGRTSLIPQLPADLVTIQERKSTGMLAQMSQKTQMTALTALKKLALAPCLCKVFLKWYRKCKLIQYYTFI